MSDTPTTEELKKLLTDADDALDRETYDQKRKDDFDAPRDAEYTVTVGTIHKVEAALRVGDGLATELIACRERVAEVGAKLATAREDALEEAAKVADEFGDLFDLPDPDDGPFTQQDKTVAQCKAKIATAIRSLKDSTP